MGCAKRFDAVSVTVASSSKRFTALRLRPANDDDRHEEVRTW
jgi:hypothetical protein